MVICILLCLVSQILSQKIRRTFQWNYEQPNRKDKMLLEQPPRLKDLTIKEINKDMRVIEQVNGEVFMQKKDEYLKLSSDLKGDEDYLANKLYPINFYLRIYLTVPEILQDVSYGQAVLYDHFIYLFGGCQNRQMKCFNTVAKFNLKTRSFEEKVIMETNRPSPRKGHQLILVGSKVYLIGGEDKQKKRNIELYIYSIEDNRWFIQDNRGQVPSYMSNMKCVLTSYNYILCYGGILERDKISNKLFMYNYLDNIWQLIETQGLLQHNKGFCKFGMVYVRQQLYLFGGQYYNDQEELVENDQLYILNLNSMVWYITQTYGEGPSKRFGMSMNRYGDDIYILGGCSKDHKQSGIYGCYNDLYILNINTLYWRHKVITSQDQWAGKEGHVALFYNPYILIFGGDNHNLPVDDDFIYMMNTNISCPYNCYRNGVCRNSCQCYQGFFENDCHIRMKCKHNCYNHGQCTSLQKCKCYTSYTGVYCQYNFNCLNNCTNQYQGKCVDYGKCECDKHFEGVACERPIYDFMDNVAKCQNECNGHGKCIYELSLCNCTLGWMGEDCSIRYQMQIPFSIKPLEDDKDLDYDFPEPEQEEEEEEEEEPEPEPPKPKEKPKPEPKEEPKEEEHQKIEYWLKQFMLGSKVKTKKKKKQKQDVRKIYRHHIENITREYNHTHTLIPDMFGLDSIDEKIIQEELVNFPKRTSHVQDCLDNCNYNGLCLYFVCYCRQGYYGKYCQYNDNMQITSGFDYLAAQFLFISFFIAGVVITVVAWILDSRARAEEDNQNIRDNAGY